MDQESDDETLERFVLRARRIQAHSLVQDWEGLRRHAEGSIEGHLDLSGRISVTRRLPEDEEAFESLASRVRPLTLEREPIYHEKVFGALERSIDPETCSDAQQVRLSHLRQAWRAAEIQSSEAQGYLLQSARLDGSEATGLVSDTQLAAAWLYADLVHADATGPKQEALAFSLRERYAAAVRLFSHLAALTVVTLQLVESLRDAGVLAVAESAWEDDVVVSAAEIVEEARAFVAPLGTAIPDMRESLRFGEGWSQLTVTELLRQDPANHVRVTLTDADGATIASYDAAVTRRPTATGLAWEALVADSSFFRFAIDLEGDQVVGSRLVSCDFFDSTNALKLASIRLQIQLHHAASVTFEVQGQALFTLGPSRLPDEQLRELEVVAETVDDVVAIERLSGQDIDPCNEGFDDLQRVCLRRARLMWEGHIVNAMQHPLQVTAPAGQPPKVILAAAGVMDIGGAQVPTPNVCMRHPDMVAVEPADVAEAGSTATTYVVRPPEGGRFMAWSPDRVQVLPNDELAATAPWNLLGIDEATFEH